MTQLLKKFTLVMVSMFSLTAMAGFDDVQNKFIALNAAINSGDRHAIVTSSMSLIVATDDAHADATAGEKRKLEKMIGIAQKLANNGYTMKFDKIEGLFGKLFTLLDELLTGEQQIGSH